MLLKLLSKLASCLIIDHLSWLGAKSHLSSEQTNTLDVYETFQIEMYPRIVSSHPMSNKDKDGRVFSQGEFSVLLEQIQTFVLQLRLWPIHFHSIKTKKKGYGSRNYINVSLV